LSIEAAETKPRAGASALHAPSRGHNMSVSTDQGREFENAMLADALKFVRHAVMNAPSRKQSLVSNAIKPAKCAR